MSAFLGPIHYWLYSKIGYQEQLTADLARYAESVGWIADASEYIRPLPALESVIDEGNIHGWLQSRIAYAESGYAELVCHLLADDGSRITALCETAFAFGKRHALPSDSSAQTAYKEFENFFVNGMPCDRINAVTKDEKDVVAWKQTQEIHAHFWTEHGGSGESFYALRRAVMDGMLAGTGLELICPDDTHYTLQIKQF